MLKNGPTIGFLVSMVLGIFVMLIPLIRYREPPISMLNIPDLASDIPLIDNGLIGVEKYPFLGIKKEAEIPKSCEYTWNESKTGMNVNSRILRILFKSSIWQ